MRKYKVSGIDSVVFDGGFVSITDRDYVLWLAEGNQPDPADAPVVPPISVTPWALCEALNQSGLRDAVESAVSAADQRTKDGWARARVFRRDNELIAGVAAAIGKTATDVDALFALALDLESVL